MRIMEGGLGLMVIDFARVFIKWLSYSESLYNLGFWLDVLLNCGWSSCCWHTHLVYSVSNH